MRLSHLSLFIALALLLAACCTPNLAAGAEPDANPPSPSKPLEGIDSAKELKAAKAKAAQANKNWETQTAEWKKRINAGQAEQMTLLVTMAANHYDVASTAHTMEEAKNACVAANPPLAQGLEQAWIIWAQEVSTALENSNQQLEAVLDHQTIGDKAELNDYLLTFRRAKGTQDALVENIPVTSEQDCTRLQETLGDTGEKLAKKLGKATRQAALDFKDVLENPPSDSAVTAANND